jgi:hypothetical protein
MDAQAELREALELIARDRRAMLERIGAALNAGNPEAVYRKLIGTLESAATRERLARAWAAAGKAHEDAVARAAGRVLRARRRKGGPRRYEMVEEAVAAQEKLDAEVRAVTGTAFHAPAHFRYALRKAFGEVTAPSFALDQCWAFAGRVAREQLGVELSGSGPGRVSFEEARGLLRGVGEEVGNARQERYRAAWFEMLAYRPEFSGDYGRMKLAERRGSLLERVVAAVLEGARGPHEGEVQAEFALLDSRFGVGTWCGLSDVAVHLLRGGIAEELREEAWCCERMPDGGTIFAFYEAAGRLSE